MDQPTRPDDATATLLPPPPPAATPPRRHDPIAGTVMVQPQ